MISAPEFQSLVQDSMEAMTDQILALQALSGLLAACATNPMPFSELPYLLDPIIDRQKALVDALMGIDIAVDSPSRTKHKSKPVLVADNG
jgi:hypothetical protein